MTKKGSGITGIQDLKGKGFSFVDPASTSGHLAPKTLLLKNGINPDKDMQTVFAGSHPTSLLSVWNGKTPAGATFEGNLLNLASSGQVKWCMYPDNKINVKRTPEELKAQYANCPDGSIVIIAQSDPIPNTPFAVRQVPAGLVQGRRQGRAAHHEGRPGVHRRTQDLVRRTRLTFKLDQPGRSSTTPCATSRSCSTSTSSNWRSNSHDDRFQNRTRDAARSNLPGPA